MSFKNHEGKSLTHVDLQRILPTEGFSSWAERLNLGPGTILYNTLNKVDFYKIVPSNHCNRMVYNKKFSLVKIVSGGEECINNTSETLFGSNRVWIEVVKHVSIGGYNDSLMKYYVPIPKPSFKFDVNTGIFTLEDKQFYIVGNEQVSFIQDVFRQISLYRWIHYVGVDSLINKSIIRFVQFFFSSTSGPLEYEINNNTMKIDKRVSLLLGHDTFFLNRNEISKATKIIKSAREKNLNAIALELFKIKSEKWVPKA